jgi:NDP-sugar pyrophosphorylase family protein
MQDETIYTIIPTGGEGRRLKPYTESRSKPLVPVINNFPILELVLYSLTYGAGLRNFIFGVKGTKHYTNLQTYFQGGSGWTGKLNITPQVHFEYQNPNYYDTGNADSTLHNIEEFGIKSPVIVAPADNIFWGNDVKRLYTAALESPYPFTVGLTHVNDASQLGMAQLDDESHKITSFVEKPGESYKNGGLVSTGIYVIKPQAFSSLQGDFGKDVIPDLTLDGKVGGHVIEHTWYDFGNPQIHLESVLSLLKSPTPCFENFLARVCNEYKDDNARVWIRGKSSFALEHAMKTLEKIKNGKIRAEGNVFIGKDTDVGEGVYLKDCAIGDHSCVGSGCEIVESNILDAWQIGKNCRIYSSFLGRGGTVSDGGLVDRQFLGDNSAVA